MRLAVLATVLSDASAKGPAVLAVASTKARFLERCPVFGEDKYYSLTQGLDGTRHCGESCMSSSMYYLYHTFDWNLTWANDTNTPCKNFGFTQYDSTSAHGFGSISITFDMYDKPPPPPHCCAGKCTASGEDKYWSLSKGEEGRLLCAETCLTSSEYYMVHMMEWNLTWANGTASPCAGLGYPSYRKTANASYGLFEVSSDLYHPSAAHEFERGVMDALGYNDAKECFDGSVDVAEQMWAIGQILRGGGAIARVKALAELALEAKEIVQTLAHCTSATTDLERYAKLVKNLQDPRYYTLHNALTLALNVADDRKMLDTFVVDLDTKKYYDAGNELIVIVLDVMSRPGIPESNGTAAVQIATGIAEGFGEQISDISCFKDARVEIPAVIGGVMQCLSGVGMVGGLESLFHGIEGIVPLFEDCLHDRPKIMSLLTAFGNFRDPHGMARLVEQNIVKNGLDLSINVAQGVLAAKGQEWLHFGQDIGKILGEIALNSTSTSFDVVV